MKNKILALILTLAMLFSFAVINASAETQYGIRVCDNDRDPDIDDDPYIQITDVNASDVLGNGTVYYDPSTDTLTLDNAKYTTNIWDTINAYKSGTIRIVVKGECILTAGDAAILSAAADDVIIEGEKDASLTIAGSPNKGIYLSNGNLTIENIAINIITATNGIYVETGNVTIKDSTINIMASQDGIGIYAGGNVTIADTYLQKLSGKNAIKATGTVSIAKSGGIVLATCLAIDADSILIADDTTIKAGNTLNDAQVIDTSKSSGSGGADWSSYKYAQLSTKYGIKGDNPTWTKGSTDGATITSTASLSLFTTVKVDDHFVDASDYSAVSGSTKISFSPAYLETLDIGDHEVTIVSKTGTATGTLTIKEATREEPTTIATTETKTEDKVADTSDNSAIATFVALTAFSAAGFVSLKKKEN